jgi:hypothetical protein
VHRETGGSPEARPPATQVETDNDESLADASGCDGKSTATAALRAWVEAVGTLSNHYFNRFQDGNRDVIQPLHLEEPNLLHARRMSRRHGWWLRVISVMQGLKALYNYQGRLAEWSRLVTEIVPDYCTDADDPVPGREEVYSGVMGYRVDLARIHDRDLSKAATLQEKHVAWDRQQAAAVLALSSDVPLDADQRHRVRSLGVSVSILGQILMKQGSGYCVPAYEETVRLDQRIGDTAAEAIAHFNIGHAYKDLPEIRDLDAAKAAYQHSLDLLDENDVMGRSACIKQIGMVYHERFNESGAAQDQTAPVLRHVQAAESHYHQALDLCPANAINELGPIHIQLGNLYNEVGQIEQAREHYEKSAQYFEQSGNRFHAGATRYNMVVMYHFSAVHDSTSSGREVLLRRAQTYAEAALRDYQHYEGRAADDEAKCQQLIDDIQQQLS